MLTRAEQEVELERMQKRKAAIDTEAVKIQETLERSRLERWIATGRKDSDWLIRTRTALRYRNLERQELQTQMASLRRELRQSEHQAKLLRRLECYRLAAAAVMTEEQESEFYEVIEKLYGEEEYV